MRPAQAGGPTVKEDDSWRWSGHVLTCSRTRAGSDLQASAFHLFLVISSLLGLVPSTAVLLPWLLNTAESTVG